MGRRAVRLDEIEIRAGEDPCQVDGNSAVEVEPRIHEMLQKAGSEMDHYFPCLHQGEVLIQAGRWEAAREVLIRSAQIALSCKNDLWLAFSHERLGDLSAAEENWFGALHHYRYALRKVDSLPDRSAMEELETKATAVQRTLHSTVRSQDADIIPLSKEYLSGPMSISFAQRDIFMKKFFARCLQCNFCHDACCSYGADVDIENVEKIQQRKEEILPFIRSSAVEWFEAGYTYYEEYAGSQYTRINTLGPRCVFISKDQRGCGLHRYALSKGMDYHEIKPLICILFPLSFEEGILSLAEELEDDSLICSGTGYSAYQAMKSELAYYFGGGLIEELDAIEQTVLRER